MSKEEVQKVADMINAVKMQMFMHFPDREELQRLLHESVEHLQKNHGDYDSAAVLNVMWSPERGDTLKEQVHAMELLAQFFDSLVKCEELKKKERDAVDARLKSARMFGEGV